MTHETQESTHYHLEEGHLCVDFVNTSSIQLDDIAPFGYITTEETLIDLPALGDWARGIDLLQPAEHDLLATQPAPGVLLRLNELLELREALRRIIRARNHAQPIPEASLAVVNRIVAPVLSRSQLVAVDDAFQVQMAAGPATDPNQVIDRIFWAIGQSAMSLLTDPDELEMISECPADDCGYLFRDTSHGRRRWCSMKSCGNRAKVQRFRDRQKISA